MLELPLLDTCLHCSHEVPVRVLLRAGSSPDGDRCVAWFPPLVLCGTHCSDTGELGIAAPLTDGHEACPDGATRAFCSPQFWAV